MEGIKGLKTTLELLANKASCHYAPVFGGVMLVDAKGKRVGNYLDIGTFLELQQKGLIDISSSMRQGICFSLQMFV